MSGRRLRPLLRTAGLSVVAFSIFVGGMVSDRYKIGPYAQLLGAARRVGAAVRRFYVDPSVVLGAQYRTNETPTPLDHEIDTALLPLRVRGQRVSDQHPIAKGSGGITIVGETVIVVDRLGAVFSASRDGGKIVQLPFPKLPNNIADYVVTDTELDDRTFRAYDVEYVPALHMLAVSHDYFDNQHARTRFAVSVIEIDDRGPVVRPRGPWKTVFMGSAKSAPDEAPASNIAGGRLTSDVDGTIYVTIGDYYLAQYEHSNVAQDPDASLGKILKLNVRTQEARVLSLGHRNQQGLVLTKEGEILSTEQGPEGGDELNVILEGSNYGWPIVSLGTDYYRYSWGASAGRHGGYREPLYAWLPAISASNLIQVKNLDPRWDGDLLVGSLKALSLFRMRRNDGHIQYVEPIRIGQRIRDLAQMADGTIVLWTDDTELMFLSIDRQRLQTNRRPGDDVNPTIKNQCLYCHHFGPTTSADFAPSLSNLIGHRIASDNFPYSAGLRAKEGNWTEQSLREFLTDPGKFANGSVMPSPALPEDEVNEVVRSLAGGAHEQRTSD